jgi:hypothetical protein
VKTLLGTLRKSVRQKRESILFPSSISRPKGMMTDKNKSYKGIKIESQIKRAKVFR